ncbi:MAG: hypothetical protein ACEQSQ_06120 [Candidatus Paceibacteria bacterium]
MLKLFLSSFIQVTMVAMNVKFIATGHIILMLITGFFISLVWSFNIKKIALGNNYDRVAYATGAMIGTGVGYFFANYLTKIL